MLADAASMISGGNQRHRLRRAGPSCSASSSANGPSLSGDGASGDGASAASSGSVRHRLGLTSRITSVADTVLDTRPKTDWSASDRNPPGFASRRNTSTEITAAIVIISRLMRCDLPGGSAVSRHAGMSGANTARGIAVASRNSTITAANTLTISAKGPLSGLSPRST